MYLLNAILELYSWGPFWTILREAMNSYYKCTLIGL